MFAHAKNPEPENTSTTELSETILPCPGAVLNWVFQGQHTTLALCLISHVAILRTAKYRTLQ